MRAVSVSGKDLTFVHPDRDMIGRKGSYALSFLMPTCRLRPADSFPRQSGYTMAVTILITSWGTRSLDHQPVTEYWQRRDRIQIRGPATE